MKTSPNRRWWALGALALCLLTVGLDATVVNIALPTLARELDASSGQLQWFADAYNLVFAAALLPAGLLGDRFGRKRLLLAALVLFGVASLGCAFASSAGELIAARAVLGLGGACLMPLSMAILPVLFSPEERPKAIGIWVAANSIAFPIGPVVGGLLLDSFWWGSVFLINVPVVIAALVAVSRLVPESRSSAQPRIDVAGVLASSAGLALLTYGAIEAGERGWGDARSLATMAAGVLVLAGFALAQVRRPGLVDLALFRSRSFTWGTVLGTLVTFALFGVLFAVPQFFHVVQGTDALGGGLRLLPVIGGLLVGARVGALVAARAGAKATVAIGFALLAAGLLTGAATAVDTGYGFAALWIAVVGVGTGFALPTAMDAALGALTAERSGVGSALIQACRQVGGTIGVAILGTVLAAGYRSELPAGAPESPAGVAAPTDAVRAAFVHGMDAMLLVCGGIAVLGILVALAFLPRRSAVPSALAAQSTA
jgi:DHA2 family multidrug resistance protein-like MFS transporter